VGDTGAKTFFHNALLPAGDGSPALNQYQREALTAG
jgi:hypothetical protein